MMITMFNFKKIIFILSVLIFSSLNPSLASEKSLKSKPRETRPTQFLIYFQPLFELSQSEARSYILKVHEIISRNDSIQFEALLDGRNLNCQKKKQKSCHPTLYFNELCVPVKKRVSVFCGQKIKTKIDFFKEPVFNRIDWNKLALTINEFCNQTLTPVCVQLSGLHNETFKKYKELLLKRKKETQSDDEA